MAKKKNSRDKDASTFFAAIRDEVLDAIASRTVMQLAEKSGVDRTAIIRWGKGERDLSQKSLADIAAALGYRVQKTH